LNVFTHEPRSQFQTYNAEEVVSVDKDVLKHVLFGQNFQAELHSKKLDDDEYVLGTIQHPAASDFTHGVPDVGGDGPRPLRRLLALDGVKHPENMSLLISTAVSMHYDGIYLVGPCIDPFNYKVLESPQGAGWTLPYCFGTPETLLALCKRHRLANYAAAAMSSQSVSGASSVVPIADLSDFDTDRFTGYCLTVGNEMKGASPELLRKSTRLALPMSELVDSLNAGVAGGILMHTMACAWPHVR